MRDRDNLCLRENCKQMSLLLSLMCSVSYYHCVQLLNCVQFFETPWTIAHQAPLSMGFSRQEDWSGLPFPPPGDLPAPGIGLASPALVDSLPLHQLGGLAMWHLIARELPQWQPLLCTSIWSRQETLGHTTLLYQPRRAQITLLSTYPGTPWLSPHIPGG